MITKFRNFLNEWSNQDRIRQIKIDETIRVYDDDDLEVIIPKTLDSACLYGKSSKWCYASKSEQDLIKKGKIKDSTFSDYLETDIFYIFLMKKENKKYTLRFETGDFVDEEGENYEFSEFIKKYPKLKELLEIHIKNGIYQKYKYPHIHLDFMNIKNDNKTNPFDIEELKGDLEDFII